MSRNRFEGDSTSLAHGRTTDQSNALLYLIAVGSPHVVACVGCHHPSALWAQAAACNLWAIGHSRALELLCEETAHECGEPLLYSLAIV